MASSRSRRRPSSAARPRAPATSSCRRDCGPASSTPSRSRPQQLKQLLMVAGYDRYFQLAHAYRDEDMRGDRQPEHTQVDIEMSFVDQEDVITTVERVVTRVAKEVLPHRPILHEPFPRLTYAEAMDRYGSDKPDIRFGMELVDLTDAVREVDFRVFSEPIAAGGAVFGIVAPGCGDYSRKQLDELIDLAKRHGAKGLVHLAVQADGALSRSGGEVPRGPPGGAAGRPRSHARRPRAGGRRCRSQRRRRGARPRAAGDGRPPRPPTARRARVRLGPPVPDVHVGRRGSALGRHPQPVQRAAAGGQSPCSTPIPAPLARSSTTSR